MQNKISALLFFCFFNGSFLLNGACGLPRIARLAQKTPLAAALAKRYFSSHQTTPAVATAPLQKTQRSWEPESMLPELIILDSPQGDQIRSFKLCWCDALNNPLSKLLYELDLAQGTVVIDLRCATDKEKVYEKILLTLFERHIKEQHKMVKTLKLEATQSEVGFYLKNGFIPTPPYEFYYKQPFTKIL